MKASFALILGGGLTLLLTGGAYVLLKRLPAKKADAKPLSPLAKVLIEAGNAAKKQANPILVLGAVATLVGGAGLLILHFAR